MCPLSVVKKGNFTNGDAAVRPHQVDIGLRNGSHTDLIIGSGEERCKGAGKCNSAITRSTADSNSYL